MTFSGRCFLVLLAAASACTSTTGVQQIATISLVPSSLRLVVHDQATLHASLVDPAGHAVTGVPIFWSSEDSSIATVSSDGVVTAMSAGAVRIAASAEGASATATVTVSSVHVAS